MKQRTGVTGGRGSTPAAVSAVVTVSTCPAERRGHARAVAPADIEPGVGAQEPTAIPDLDLALVLLGVDHEHAGRGNQDVVDVAADPSHTAVMQNEESLDALEGFGQLLLAPGAGRPSPRRLRIVGQRQDGTTEASEPSANPRLSVVLPALVLPTRRRASDTGVEGLLLREA